MSLNRWMPILIAPAVFAGCLESGSRGSEGSTDVVTLPPIETEVLRKTPGIVCGALEDSPVGTLQTGVVGNLYYNPDASRRPNSVHQMMIDEFRMGGISLLFNQINVPTRPWDRGFYTTTGEAVLNHRGEPVYEDFGLDLYTSLKLGEGDSPGLYQFGLIADDGAVMERMDDNSMLVNNDGIHPTKMACSTQAVEMDANSRIPVRIRYYQGPRYHIALMALWRPWNTANPMDPECSQAGSNNRYFDSTVNPPAPQAAYIAMQTRGWKPLANTNYQIPDGVRNICSIPAPTNSNINVADLTATSVTMTWTTDVPSTSQVELLGPDGVVISSPVDDRLVTEHSVTVTGLTPLTIYTVTVISSSDSGRSTRGPDTTIRTRR